MNDYIRKVNYHETDKMGITHHSNYIRWLEEARIDFLEQIGCGYAKMEAQGVMSPVIGVECEYKQSTTFGDEVRIHVELEEFKRVDFAIRYTITNNATGALVLLGKTRHCFINSDGRPVALKKVFPEADAVLRSFVSAGE